MISTHLVRARIVGHQSMQEFGERFADPLHHALQERGYGDITGGDGQYDASGLVVEWLSIDIQLTDLDLALEFTRRTLKELGAPFGSELAYTVEGETHTMPIDDSPVV